MDDPSAVRGEWADRNGAYSPTYYAHRGPDETSEVIRVALDRYVGSDSAVLEIGCSAGRHLAHLHDHSFRQLAGIEINQTAFDVMDQAYPSLAMEGSFHLGAIEEVLPRIPDDQFDAVFSVETLQHVHPDEASVFGDLARVTDNVLLTAEIEERGGRQVNPDPEGADPGAQAHGDLPPDEAGSSPSTPDSEVTFVDDGLPLFYRNWHGIFTEIGLEQIQVTGEARRTIRVFRHSGD